jgi:hypothetical protein
LRGIWATAKQTENAHRYQQDTLFIQNSMQIFVFECFLLFEKAKITILCFFFLYLQVAPNLFSERRKPLSHIPIQQQP